MVRCVAAEPLTRLVGGLARRLRHVLAQAHT